MIARWRIDKSPTSKDPGRRVLLLKGGMEDVRRLLKSFGAMCGRPRKEKGRSFNLSLVLHSPASGDLDRLETEIRALSGQEVPAPPVALQVRAEPPSAPPLPPPAAPRPAPPPVLRLAPEPPPAPKAPDLPTVEIPAVPVPILAPEWPAPAAARAPAPAPASVPVPARAPAPTPTPQSASGGVSPLKLLRESPLCGACLDLDASKNLDSLSVGAFNRFAHAAAMAVAASPGSMYNPLFVSGVAGTGKTHLAHALAAKLVDAGPVLLSSGPRLALAVTLALKSGRMREISEFAGRARSLVVDDLHLLGLSEDNRGALAALFSGFLGDHKQMVVASAYSPKLMGAFEDALGVRLSTGQVVELKNPREEEQREIIASSLLAAGFPKSELDDDGGGRRLAADFPQLGLNVRRLRRLRDLRERLGSPAPLSQLIDELSGPAALPAQSEQELAKAPPEAAEPASGEAAAVFFPKGEESRADWMWLRLRRLAEERRWPFPWRRAARLAYDPSDAYGIPFWIADQCQRVGPQAALVLAPASGELAENSAEVRAALGSLVECLRVRLGWIPHGSVGVPARYLQAYLDMRPEGE